jgi:Domain of unknown function (DUF927)
MRSDNRDERDAEERSIGAVSVIGQYRSGLFWFVVFQFQDAEGVDQTVSIPRKDCQSAHTLRSYLVERGARLTTDTEWLREIVSKIVRGDLPVIQPAAVSGWHENSYLFGDQFIGAPDRSYAVLRNENARYPLELASEGSARAWSVEFADLPSYSSPLTLAACVALGSVMAGPLGIEPRMIHLFWDSTGGKTLALIVARSVFGNPSRDRIPTWNTTAAGFEELAAQVRDHVLVLDEATFRTGSIDDERLLKEIHYGFTTNQSKRRSRLYELPQDFVGAGSSKLGLSAGELSFTAVAKRFGSTRFRGAVLRAVDVPADLEYGLGVFRKVPSDLERLKDGSRILAQRLEAAAIANYGWVGKHFIADLIAHATWKDDARRRMADFQRQLKAGSDGYSVRFAEIFALAYAAGRAAIDADLVEWSSDDLRRAITRMHRAARAIAASPREACSKVLRRLHHELARNAVNLDRREKITDEAFDRANAFFRDDSKLGHIYLVKPGYIQKLCGIELSSREVATALQKLRVLLPESAAIPTRQVMIGADRPRMRYYCISASFVRR